MSLPFRADQNNQKTVVKICCLPLLISEFYRQREMFFCHLWLSLLSQRSSVGELANSVQFDEAGSLEWSVI